MTMTLTFTGNWCDIADEMRAMLNVHNLDIRWLKVDGESIPAAVTDTPQPADEAPAPRTRRKKAEAPVADEPQAPEPIYESTATTPLVEDPAPSVDAPVATQASTSAPGSDAPASGTVTPASEVAYADVVAAVTDLARAKGPDAVKQALGEMGLTTAKGTSPDVWPAIIDAMRTASEIAL